MDFGLTDLVKGVKTFFIVPDVTIFPETHLKSFFMRGYETYFLHAEPEKDLEAQIHALFSLFPEVILFSISTMRCRVSTGRFLLTNCRPGMPSVR